jgi:hypothetical protein
MVRALAAVLPWLILTCTIAVAAKTPPAKPPVAVEPPMRVSIVKSAVPGCEPQCPEWIAAEGKIDAGALARFKSVLKQLGARKLPVLIHSGGGDMDASFAIGRLLKKGGFDVAVARTLIIPCAASEPGCRKNKAGGAARGLPDEAFAVCASACAFVLAAGSRRFVGPRAFVGVHQVMLMQTFNKVLRTYQVTVRPSASGRPIVQKKLVATEIVSRKVIPKKAPQSTYARIEAYFAEMGVTRQIMPMLQDTPHAAVRWLTHDELRGTGIATHRMSAAQLIAGITVADDGWRQPTGGPGFVLSPPAECQSFSGIGIGCSPLVLPQGADWSTQAPNWEPPVPAR